MSWIQTLYDTYEYLSDFNFKNPGSVEGLLPPAILQQKAQLTVVLDEDSNFVRAEVVNFDIKLPATQDSLYRTGAEPHALFDQLKYVAGDLKDYNGGKNADHEKKFVPYIKNLSKLCETWPNEYVNIIYKYLEKKCLVHDLIKYNIFKEVKGKENEYNIKDHFVIFAIEKDGEIIKLWEDYRFLNDYSKYYIDYLDKNKSANQGLCYVCGKVNTLSKSHGKYIRFPGDGSKLISSNDDKNYTFKGRFYSADEACGISFEVSEKSHSVLRYLIRKQGYNKNGFTILVWSVNGEDIINPMYDTDDLSFLSQSGFDVKRVDTNENFANELNRAINGYKSNLSCKNVNLIVMDSPSLPKNDKKTIGRMSILYYNEKNIDDYLEAIKKWHLDLAWVHYYKKDDTDK